jgi:phosphatidylethanolamine/phosphatidyl-N-methylethanolamine N-methyltransferase
VSSSKPKSFLKRKLHRFIELGAVAPSSRFLAKRMVSHIEVKENLVVVELGPGTGTFTKAILKRLPASVRLIALEINEKAAHRLTDKIKDPRLEVIIGNASNISTYLLERGIYKAHYIISGLPLGNFSTQSVSHILNEIKRNLTENGSYIQFQYFLASLRQIKKIFPHVSIRFEPRNIPPAFVLVCKKSEAR